MNQIWLTFVLYYSLAHVDAEQWPYDRYLGEISKSGKLIPRKKAPEFENDPSNGFLHWLHHVVGKDPDDGPLSQTFVNGSIPPRTTWDELIDHLNIPTPPPSDESKPAPPVPPYSPDHEAKAVFSHLTYPVDVRCTSDEFKW
jgi:hypothetical protein